MEALLVLICFAEVDIDQDILAIFINHNIRPLENTLRIKVTVLWYNIGLSEQAIKSSQEGAPEREVTGFVSVNVPVHPSENSWIDREDKLTGSFEPPLNTLQGCL